MKQSEVVKLSVEELQQQMEVANKEYQDLKISHATSPLDNPLELRSRRRAIARMATELTKRSQQ